MSRGPDHAADPSIPGYELLEPLGGGPMTAVYAARDAADRRALRRQGGARRLGRPGHRRQAAPARGPRRPPRPPSAPGPRPPRPRHAAAVFPGDGDGCPASRCGNGCGATTASTPPRPSGSLARPRRRWPPCTGPASSTATSSRTTSASPAAVPTVLIDLGFAHRPGENAAFLREGYVLGTADYLAPELCDPEPERGPERAIASVWE